MHARKPAWTGEFQVKLCSSARHAPIGRALIYPPQCLRTDCCWPRSTTCRRASRARSIGCSSCLQPHVGDRFAMLVVPNHWGDAPIVPGSALRLATARLGGPRESRCSCTASFIATRCGTRRAADRLRAGLHDRRRGRVPRALAGPRRAARIGDGRALIEDVIGRPIDGLRRAGVALRRRRARGAGGLRGCDRRRSFARVVAGDRRSTGSGPVITWASRTRLRLASSLIAAAALRRCANRCAAGRRASARYWPSRVSSRSIEKTLRSAASTRRARALFGSACLLRRLGPTCIAHDFQ